MAGSPNLKINIGADTSQFSKGAKQVKDDLRSLNSVASDSVSRLGEAFGVNTGKLQQMAEAARGLGTKLEASGVAGVASFGKMLSSISAASVAIAGLGIAAAAISFKALNAEAENFKTTVQGANIEMMTAAYVDTYTQVLHDFNAATGEGVAKAESRFEKFFKTFGANFRQYFASNQAAFSLLDPMARQQLESAGVDTNPFYTQMATAAEKGKQAEAIANRIYEIQRALSDETVRQSLLDAEIAKNKQLAWDRGRSLQEQSASLNKVIELIAQKYGGENGLVSLNQELADLMVEMNSLASSTPAQIDAANAQQVKANMLIAQQANMLRELSERQTSIAQAIKKENEELAKQKALRANSPMASPLAGGSLTDLLPTAADTEYGKTPAIVQPVLFATDEKNLQDFSQAVQSTIGSMAEGMSAAIGNLLGDLATGGDAWGNFGNAAISAMGDMAIQIGKIAIETGVAALGIKAALESLNPYAAIAAGAALVALGYAVKTAMSNVASSNYAASGGASIASSTASYGSSFNNFDSREIKVNVTGQLVADGSQLISVINTVNNRRNQTT